MAEYSQGAAAPQSPPVGSGDSGSDTPPTTLGIQGTNSQPIQGQQIAQAAPQQDYSNMFTPPAPQMGNSASQAPSNTNDYSSMFANPTQQKSTGSTVMDKIGQYADEFNYTFDRMALGTMQRVGQGVSALNSVLSGDDSGVGKSLQTYNDAINKTLDQKTANYNAAWQQNPGVGSYIASGLGKLGAGVAYGSLGATALPETIAASVPASGAAIGAGIGYLDPSKSGLETGLKTIGGGLLGAAIPVAMNVGKGLVNKLISPGDEAANTIANVIKSDPKAAAQMQEATNAAQVIKNATGQDVNLSAGTVFNGSDGVAGYGAKEASLRPTLNAQNNIIRPQLNTQISNTKNNILNTVNSMASPTDEEAMKQGYNALNNEYVTSAGKLTTNPEEAGLPDALTSHGYTNDYLSAIKDGKSDVYKAIPENSLGQLQAAKTAINDRLYNGSAANNLSPDEQIGLNESLSKINPILGQSDNYNTANTLAQKFQIQQGYQDKLAKLNLNDASLSQISSKLFPGDEGHTQFLQDVAATGGDPNLAKATLYMADKLGKSPLLNALKGAGEKIDNNGGGIPAGPIALTTKAVTDHFSTRYSKALLDMTLNQNKWGPMIQEALSQPSTPARTSAFANIMKSAILPAVGASRWNNSVTKAAQ